MCVIEISTFNILLGLFECSIGIAILFLKFTKIISILILLHIFTTALPLILLPEFTWQQFGILTIEGQYIVKNLLNISALMSLNYFRMKEKSE